MVKDTSYMFVTGPEVVRTVTHEEVTFEELGGAMVHNSTSGVAHFAAQSEPECLHLIRRMISYMPSNNAEDPPFIPTDDPADRMDAELDHIVPVQPMRGYDVREVIRRVVDNGEFLEVHEHWAQNLVVGFARLGGQSVGIVAQQPAVLAGVLDINSSTKGARFVRFCDCFNIPLVTFVDVPGFLPGVGQEHGGIIRHGAKLLYAYCEATVPKVTVILRKAYGGAYDVMGSKHLGADINLAWPTAQIAVMGAQGAVNILYRSELAQAQQAGEDVEAARRRLVTEYEDTLANPYVAAERGYVDSVIPPSYTRSYVIKALRALRGKRETLPPKKHGNIPL
jgi:acetyl-CoA carboxylase carboxyltransferase component